MANLQSKLYKSIYHDDPTPIVNFMQWLVDDYQLLPEDRPLQVLDIGCGPGRMLPAYAALGWQVTGMEPDEDYFEQAEEVADDLPDASVRQGGFQDINDESTFDLIAAVNDPFSHLLTVSERSDALSRCYRALRPGGVLFLDSPNFLYIMRHYEQPYPTNLVVDGRIVVRTPRHEIDYHNGLWTHTDSFHFEDTNETLLKTHRYAIVNPAELFHSLKFQGFVGLATYNSYGARGHEVLDARRIMLSVRRPLANLEAGDVEVGPNL